MRTCQRVFHDNPDGILMELWIPITIFAAFMQNARSALQKHLKGRLTTLGATYVRFLYATPFALAYLAGLHLVGGLPLPAPNQTFLIYVAFGGVSQIAFTFLLLWLFSFRNFAAGTTFSKTEVVQIAVLGFLVLGDTLTLASGAAILLAAFGVVVLSAAQTNVTLATLLTSLTEKSTLIGLASGAFLGASVVFFRGAALSLDYPGFLMAAGFTLAMALIFQTVIMGLYLAWQEPATLKAVVVHWRWSMAVGVTGMLASVGWFTAFTLENASYVRAVGQIELIFTFAASIFFFREKTNGKEVLGILLVAAGIILLILTR
ncbi:MAG: DMT family transporter [Alphaproteobacteria bacterium]|nr:DMT family transporter [Alphaproteobacteria bacterium]